MQHCVLAVGIGVLAAWGATAAEDRRAYPALFERAAAEFDVPADVLKGVAFAETRWAHLTWPARETASPCNGMPRPFGIMSLWDNEWFGHSLVEAAALIGEPVEVLKSDVFQNIRGAAALLKKRRDELPLPEGTTRRDVEGWRNAIISYCGIPQSELAQQHALDVYAHINRGYHQHGIEFPGRPVNLEPIREEVRRIRAEAARGGQKAGKQEVGKARGKVEPAGEGEALFVPASQPDYPLAIWRPAYPGHWYTTGVGRYFVVIHDMEGYYLSTISYFQRETTQASAHYCVNGVTDYVGDAPPGEITQMVEERYWAWHARCWNPYMLGIEHEGLENDPAWYTEAQYQASALLTRYLCDKYGIPKDRNHIIAHGEHLNAAWRTWMAANWPEIDATCNNHYDPGPNWDWPHYMALVLGDVNSAAVAGSSVPDSVAPGATFSATITMLNNGTKPWTSDATPHRLGSQNPQDTTRWGLSRVNLSSSPINPGASATFTFACTAPVTTGSYAFDWRMVEENTEWFGATFAKTITVAIPPPTITTQPTNVVRNLNEAASFTVVANGTAPLSYQWRKNGVPIANGGGISGATSPTLSFASVSMSQAGFYTVTVSNAVGTTISQQAQLIIVATAARVGTGTGLRALVFDNVDFTSMKRARIDATINFDWNTNSPSSTTDPDTFSMRWLGQVQPRYSQTYTFYASTDDGVRLWVNGVLLIDKWQDQGATERTGSIALNAGEKYDLRMDYYENGGAASAELSWSSASQAKEIIPSTQLYRLPPAFLPITNKLAVAGSTLSFTVVVTNQDPWLSSQPITDFNDFADSQDDVMFRNPAYSGSTDQFVDPAETNYAAVVAASPAGNNSARSLKARWAVPSGAANPWLRLTTANMPNLPNPAIDLSQSLWFDVHAERPVRVAVGARETGTTTAIGGDGGQSGGIEFVGATGVTGGQPNPTRLVAAGSWTTLRFDLSREPTAAFTGNGVLSSTNGRGALEHIAIVPADGAGVYRIHVDNFLSVVNNRMSYALGPGAPAGASINTTNGVFSWTIPGGQPTGTYPITILASDSGAPSLTSTQSFNVLVSDQLALRATSGATGKVTLWWTAVTGQRYRVQFKSQLTAPAWQELAVVTAASDTASFEVLPGDEAGQRFYRLVID